MANPEHVALVRKGAAAIAAWWQAHPDERLDLSEADLSGADLTDDDLSGAYLVRANLSEANLVRANLSEANLVRANLSAANLYGANLYGANLRGANLYGANLSGANLPGADLYGASLGKANLQGANLYGANLYGAHLYGALLGLTSLTDLDLSAVKGLTDVRQFVPSSIGVDTLVASVRGAGGHLTPELTAFFRGAGVPEELLKEVPRIVAEVKYHTCFISYGQPDLQLATKLYEDLRSRGVSCWLYEMDKTVGKPTWGEIEEQLDRFEKMVVLCSIDALLRDGVKKEIDKQIDKNADNLVPVSLENRWTQRGFKAEWADRDLRTWLKDRNYADFANKPYDEALEDLLKGLRREQKPAD